MKVMMLSKFKGKTGKVIRESDRMFCIVIDGVWDHGIWFFREDFKFIK